jgi:hypothetical protein
MTSKCVGGKMVLTCGPGLYTKFPNILRYSFLRLFSPPRVTLLYLYYWYYCSDFFSHPPTDTPFSHVDLSILYGISS